MTQSCGNEAGQQVGFRQERACAVTSGVSLWGLSADSEAFGKGHGAGES